MKRPKCEERMLPFFRLLFCSPTLASQDSSPLGYWPSGKGDLYHTYQHEAHAWNAREQRLGARAARVSAVPNAGSVSVGSRTFVRSLNERPRATGDGTGYAFPILLQGLDDVMDAV